MKTPAGSKSRRGAPTRISSRRSPTAALRTLLRILHRHEVGDAAAKLAHVELLTRARFGRAADVLTWHEALLFLRAYPDDEDVLAASERALRSFAARADLRRFRAKLENSGVVGTPVSYRFYPPTALRLARAYGPLLRVDWDEFEHDESLSKNLWMMLPWCESGALDDDSTSVRDHVLRLKGPSESDAEFLVKRIDALPMHVFARERFAEDLDLPLRLLPDAHDPSRTPSRTLARFDTGPIALQRGPMRHSRPDLSVDVLRPPVSIRAVNRSDARRLVELTRDAMVTRSRDLEAFMHADERDVRLVDCGEGLCFAVMGVKPERRLLLESVYGFLTLKNGVPIGYVLASALMNSAEVAYNVFDAYRGAEAAYVYGRALATIHALFDVDTFTVYPYQLGHENDEGLRSGAWWFYKKLGFEPRDAGARRAMASELARVKRDPDHRSSLATLKVLAAHNVFFDRRSPSRPAKTGTGGATNRVAKRSEPRHDVIGEFPLDRVAAGASRYLAQRFGAERERGVEVCAHEVARALGVKDVRRWSASERLWLERLAPVLACLDVARWTVSERRALVPVIRAKGGQRESDYVRLFDRHRRLRRELNRWVGIR